MLRTNIGTNVAAIANDDALATVAQFVDEITRADAPVAPRSRESAEVLRAALLVVKSQDGATVRAEPRLGRIVQSSDISLTRTSRRIERTQVLNSMMDHPSERTAFTLRDTRAPLKWTVLLLVSQRGLALACRSVA